MHKVIEILNAVTSSLSTVSLNNKLVKVERYKPDLPIEYPLIRVSMGNETSESESFDFDERQLTVYIDIYVSNTTNTVEDDALSIRLQVENIIKTRTGLNIELQQARLIEQLEPTYNDQVSDDYSAMFRLSWLFTYLTESIY